MLLLLVVSSFAADEVLLTPSDFGLHLNQCRQIDLHKLPPNIVIGNFNGDNYPDIARFIGEFFPFRTFPGEIF